MTAPRLLILLACWGPLPPVISIQQAVTTIQQRHPSEAATPTVCIYNEFYFTI
jgi:hypothetical protein